MALGEPPATIHSMSSLRDYSDFFASGFRAVSNRLPRRPLSFHSTIAHRRGDPTDNGGLSRRPNRFLTKPQRRNRRPASMIVSSTTIPTSTHENPRGRRSSIVAFSSRFFDRMMSASADENPSSISNKSRSMRASRVLEDSNSQSQIPEVWITAGGPYTPSAPNGGTEDFSFPSSIDPFTSSPESKSFFVELSDSSPSETSKRNSFLSITTNSSQDRSLLHHPRRDRPISIQTMPLPSRSRRSSFHYRLPAQDKSDFWILEEEPAVLTTESPIDYDNRDETARIDWRQFHIDLLNVEV